MSRKTKDTKLLVERASEPCVLPIQRGLFKGEDCGTCPPCRARRLLERESDTSEVTMDESQR